MNHREISGFRLIRRAILHPTRLRFADIPVLSRRPGANNARLSRAASDRQWLNSHVARSFF
ncbi:MAG: hypothetical protein ACJAVS_000696 [Paracoccaceae bacterium]|jgi:hypothetical protein